jgi:hypothetical protein
MTLFINRATSFVAKIQPAGLIEGTLRGEEVIGLYMRIGEGK